MLGATITTLCDMIDHARNRLDDVPDTTDLTGDNLSVLQQTEESQNQDNLLFEFLV